LKTKIFEKRDRNAKKSTKFERVAISLKIKITARQNITKIKKVQIFFLIIKIAQKLIKLQQL